MSRATMTRRGFLKSTAAMGAVTALGISAADSLTAVDPAHADEASDVKIIKTSCRACIASCAVLAHVRDGRVVKIEGNPESPMSQGRRVCQGPRRHPGALSPEPQQVPHAPRGRARKQPVGAHLVGGGAHRGRDQDQRSVRQVRLRGHLRFHGRRRKPALLEREALRRGHQHPQRVGAGLLAVLPAPHGRLASGLRRRQAQQPVVLRLQRLGLLLHRQPGDLARALGHRPVQLLGGHRRPRPGRAAQSPGGPAHRGHRPPLHPGRRQGRGVAAHPPRHRCGPLAQLDRGSSRTRSTMRNSAAPGRTCPTSSTPRRASR